MDRAGDQRNAKAALFQLFAGNPSGAIARDGLISLLGEAGFSEPLAGRLANLSLALLKERPSPFAMHDALVAITAAIGSLAWIVPALWFEELLRLHPELRQPPVEAPPTTVPGVGIVHRGRTAVTDGDLPRDYFWIWLQRDPNAACPEFRWYQFVRPRLFINGVDVGADETFEPATGLRTTFGKWNPDYHVDPSRQEDRDRLRDGLPKLPGFTPDLPPDTPGGDPPDVEPGKPHIEAKVPGAHGVTGVTSTGPRALGLLDSPNFTQRPKPDVPSQIEQSWHDNTPRWTGEAPPPPLTGTDIVEVRVEMRSYLVCIEDGEARCIGCVSWTHTSRAELRWDWIRDVGEIPELGMVAVADRRWKRRVLNANYRLTNVFGGWGAC
jgi:hypothetical protein